MIGTSHETTFSQVVADTLGVSPNDVTVVEGDTYACPIGQGSFSDRSSVYTISATKVAAEKLRLKLLTIGSKMLGSASNDLDINDGKVYVKREPNRNVTIGDIARLVYLRTNELPEEIEAGLEATHYFSIRGKTYAPGPKGTIYYPCFGSGCQVALVQVDIETGKVAVLKYVAVHDVGKIINPLIVEGQLVGAIVAAMGGAMNEE